MGLSWRLCKDKAVTNQVGQAFSSDDTVARTANDIDFLIDSLPSDKCCIELQIASLGKLQ